MAGCNKCVLGSPQRYVSTTQCSTVLFPGATSHSLHFDRAGEPHVIRTTSMTYAHFSLTGIK